MKNKIRSSIDKINVLISKGQKTKEKLEKSLAELEKRKTSIQIICNHSEHKLVGREPGSDKSLFKCSACDFVGYHTDFK